MLITSACTDFDTVRRGMTEEELRRLVGAPDRRLKKDALGVYASKDECAKSVESALVYKRVFRSDVIVGLDANSRVACTWRAFVVEVTY
jgi:hypothetical protein